MGRSIIELDRALHPGRGRKRTSAKAPPPRGRTAAPSPSQSLAKMLSRRRPVKGVRPAPGRARAFDAIDVAVKGTVGPLRQASAMTCWATVYTMLLGWKEQRSTSVEAAIAGVGPRWSALLAKGATTGMSGAEKVDFIADAGLVAVPAMNPSIGGWADMVANYGPLWMTTDEAAGPGFSIHARLLTAIRGDGTAEGTMLHFINPSSGAQVQERFRDFLGKFESEAATPGRPLRIQIVHWPAGAQSFALAYRPAFGRAASVPPALFPGVARNALVAALVQHGVDELVANGLVEAFAAEVRAEGGRPIPLGYDRPRAFDAEEGTDEDPDERAREILKFFYPDKSFGSITANHRRLAAKLLFLGLQTQKWLNRVPGYPTSQPGPGWLVKEAAKMLWRELRGRKGISLAARNTIARNWKSVLRQIEDGLDPPDLSDTQGLGYGQPRALDAEEDKDTPEERARKILKFFYPDSSFDSITENHKLFAAALLYKAVEMQKWLNRLPGIPTSRPGPAWLLEQTAKILWREIRGPKGISTKARNTIAWKWRHALDQIRNGLEPVLSDAQGLSYVEQQGLADWIRNPDIPLSPALGGLSLSWDALATGDLIVSTTTQAPSIAIRRIGSPVSHAMLYIGGGQVVEAIGEGVVLRTLEQALSDSFVGVAFRHPKLTPQQALAVRDFVGRKLGSQYDYDLIAAHAKFQLGRMVCDSLPEEYRDACMSRVGPVDLGRGTDERFICSSLVAEAFEHAGAPLLPVPARGATPGDLALSTRLVYLGHVKYDPPTGLADRLGRM